MSILTPLSLQHSPFLTGHIMMLHPADRFLKKLWQAPFTVMAWLYGAAMFGIIAGIIQQDVPTDIQAHTDVLILHVAVGSFPVPPFYFASIYLLSFLLGNHLLLASAVVLGLAGLARYWVAGRYTQPLLQHLAPWPAALVLLALMFLAPVPWHLEGYWYVGKFSALVVHNSTILFAFPFCIWLFYLGLHFFEKPTWRLTKNMLLAMTLVALAKPNYLFAFVPCFWLFCWLKRGQHRGLFLKATLLAAAGAALVLAEKLWMDYANTGIYGLTSIRLAPFATWLHFSRMPVMDLLMSFPLVLVATTLFPSLVFRSPETRFAMAIAALSIGLYWLLAETGERAYASNFSWQIPVAVFLLHLSLFRLFGSQWPQVRQSPKLKWVLLAGGFQLLGGMAYIVRVFVTRDYM